jgi:hypothetical protein
MCCSKNQYVGELNTKTKGAQHRDKGAQHRVKRSSTQRQKVLNTETKELNTKELNSETKELNTETKERKASKHPETHATGNLHKLHTQNKEGVDRAK